MINKPYGLLSVSAGKETDNTAFSLVSYHLKRKTKNSKVFVVHRLDRETSGVLLFAKNEKMKKLLQNNWNDLVSKRGYIAVVEGKVKPKEATIKSWLKENKEYMVYSTKSKSDGKLAITNYKVLQSNDNYSLLEIFIDTGRKNQIRVHMKDIKHPIIGDEKYNSKINPIKRLGLYAHILELTNPLTNKIMTFKIKIPYKIKNIIKK